MQMSLYIEGVYDGDEGSFIHVVLALQHRAWARIYGRQIYEVTYLIFQIKKWYWKHLGHISLYLDMLRVQLQLGFGLLSSPYLTSLSQYKGWGQWPSLLIFLTLLLDKRTEVREVF